MLPQLLSGVNRRHRRMHLVARLTQKLGAGAQEVALLSANRMRRAIDSQAQPKLANREYQVSTGIVTFIAVPSGPVLFRESVPRQVSKIACASRSPVPNPFDVLDLGITSVRILDRT